MFRSSLLAPGSPLPDVRGETLTGVFTGSPAGPSWFYEKKSSLGPPNDRQTKNALWGCF